MTRKEKAKENADARIIQERLRCKGCRFADKKALGKRPCCTYPGSLVLIEEGRCARRRES